MHVALSAVIGLGTAYGLLPQRGTMLGVSGPRRLRHGLLYNLGHFAGSLPVTGGALAVLAVARRFAREPARAGPTVAAATDSVGWFLVVFLVPALPLRYGLNFGVPLVSVAAAAVVVCVALWRGWPRVLLGPLAVAVAAGALGAIAGYVPARGFPEARLLAAAAGILLAGGAACSVVDRRLVRRGAGPSQSTSASC